jgi:hypothetical protein
MTTITTTATAQPWWVNHNATYLAVYYARTIARIWRAASAVNPRDNARDLVY